MQRTGGGAGRGFVRQFSLDGGKPVSHAAIRARRLTFPSSGEAHADAVINPLPRKYGAPPSARPGPGFEPVVIREGDERRCRCGHCWTGPAKTAADARGYFWNCPGCVDKLTQE